MSGGLRHRQLPEWRERFERSAMRLSLHGLGVGTPLVAGLRSDDTPRVNFHVRTLHWRHSNMHSFTEWPLLGGFGLACKPSLAFDGFNLGRRHFDGLSLGRRHDGHFRRRCPFLRTFVSFVIIIQFSRPRSPPRHDVLNQPVTKLTTSVQHQPNIPHVLCLRPAQNLAFTIVPPSTTYARCETRKTVGYIQKMNLFKN